MLEWVLVIHALVNTQPITSEFHGLSGWICSFATSSMRKYIEYNKDKPAIVMNGDVATSITVHCEEREVK